NRLWLNIHHPTPTNPFIWDISEIIFWDIRLPIFLKQPDIQFRKSKLSTTVEFIFANQCWLGRNSETVKRRKVQALKATIWLGNITWNLTNIIVKKSKN